MNITLDAQYSSPKATNAENNTSTYRASTNATQMWQCGYQLDITDKVMDDKAYQGQGSTTAKIMQEAQNTNVQVQKDFMLVMSNCVSGEDLKKMAEDGFEPGSTDVETYVSIVDQIKVTLAKAGVEIAGFNDDLDAEMVEKITGSRIDANMLCDKFAQADLPLTKENIEAVLQADEEAQELTELSEDALKYMVVNAKAPTIENMYLAQHSSARDIRQAQGYYGEAVNGYYAKKADTIDFSQIEEQIAQVIEESGLEDKETALEQAKWLIASGIELTGENLTRLSELKEIALPKSAEEVIDMAVTAMKNGKAPVKACMTGEVSLLQQAQELIEEVNEISDEAIHQTVEAGQDLNIINLHEMQMAINEGKAVVTSDETSASDQLKEIEAKRKLEEIRLMMSLDANKQLLKSGFQIDTSDLEDLVEALKETEAQLKASMFQGETAEENTERASLYEQTIATTQALYTMPAAVLGKVVESEDSFTLSYLHEEGTILQSQYTKAGTTYEALMTAPRADLGDKISKAFQNVDDILKDMNLEVNADNERAVRILGYNRMDITEENIEAVKQADHTVTRVMNKMTPASTLQMIRDGKNPLEMDMNELEDYLDKQEQQSGKDTERFSTYLQKLEHQKGITEEERKAYMGVYRMFRQIEKSDGAVIGNIVATGAEMNFKNMLSAVRSKAKGKMDVSIDEEYGSLEKLITKGEAIDTQIMTGYQHTESNLSEEQQKRKESYYAKLSGEITKSLAEDISAEQLQQLEMKEYTTIEKFSEEVREQAAKEQTSENKKIEEKTQEFRSAIQKAKQVDEAVLEELITYDQAVSIDNIEALTSFLFDRGSIFKQVFAREKKEEEITEEAELETSGSEEGLEEQALKVMEQLTDAKAAKTSYQELIDKSVKVVEESLDQSGIGRVDIKAAQALMKGLTLAGNLAKEENYEIPMKINGEMTSVNVKIYHDSNQKGKVTVTMDTETLGKVVADLEVNENKLSGMVVYEKREAAQIMEELESNLQTKLQSMQNGDRNVSISFASVKRLDLKQFGTDKDEGENLSTKELYETAKAFMTALKETVS